MLSCKRMPHHDKTAVVYIYPHCIPAMAQWGYNDKGLSSPTPYIFFFTPRALALEKSVKTRAFVEWGAPDVAWTV